MSKPTKSVAPTWLAPSILALGGAFVLCLGCACVAGISLIWLRFSMAEELRPATASAPAIYASPQVTPRPSAPTQAGFGPDLTPITGPSPNAVGDDELGHLEVAMRVDEVRGRAGVREGGACRLTLDVEPPASSAPRSARCSGHFVCGTRTLWQVERADAFACDVATDTGWLSAHDDATGQARPSLTATFTGERTRVTLYRTGAPFLFLSAASQP